jgi:hypothetical protein
VDEVREFSYFHEKRYLLRICGSILTTALVKAVKTFFVIYRTLLWRLKRGNLEIRQGARR